MNGISTTQLAKICGVSQGTVDRALNNRKGINENTKKKVLAVAKEYGYRPNLQGRGFCNQRLKNVGIILSGLDNKALAEFTDKLQKSALAKGHSVVIAFTSQSAESEIERILSLYHMGVVGLILSPVNSGDDFKKFLWSLDLPILTLNKRIDSIPCLTINEESSSNVELAVKISSDYIIDSKPILDTVEI